MDSLHAEETEHRSWFDRLHLSWPMLFLIGWLLYELTTQPTVGAVAVCLKFGWEDFRTAIWLRRVDPRRMRGRACFWLYLAAGLAKTAGVAGLMSFAFVAISPKLGNPQVRQRWAAVMEMATWTGLAMLTGFICSMFTLGYASVLARWGRFRLWLSSDIHRARSRNHWPPYVQNSVGNNRLEALFFIILFVVFLPFYLCFLFTVFTVLMVIVPGGPGGRAAILGSGGLALLVGGGAIFLLRLKDRMKLWIASHPSECWDDVSATSPEAERMVELSGNPLK
jgi:hypothetical protein